MIIIIMLLLANMHHHLYLVMLISGQMTFTTMQLVAGMKNRDKK